MQLLSTSPLPPLFLGPDGAGKSSMIRYCLKSFEEQGSLQWKHLRLCARTRACDVQAFIETGLEKKRKTKLGPPAGSRLIIFVDDVNVVEADGFGTQPALEQLRQLQDRKVQLQCLSAPACACSTPESALALRPDDHSMTLMALMKSNWPLGMRPHCALPVMLTQFACLFGRQSVANVKLIIKL